jgi:hypothetical protein
MPSLTILVICIVALVSFVGVIYWIATSLVTTGKNLAHSETNENLIEALQQKQDITGPLDEKQATEEITQSDLWK